MRTQDQNRDPNLLDNCINGFSLARCRGFDSDIDLYVFMPGLGRSIVHGVVGSVLAPGAKLAKTEAKEKETDKVISIYTPQFPTDELSGVEVTETTQAPAVPLDGMRHDMHSFILHPNQQCAPGGSYATFDGSFDAPISLRVHITGDTAFKDSLPAFESVSDAMTAMALQEESAFVPYAWRGELSVSTIAGELNVLVGVIEDADPVFTAGQTISGYGIPEGTTIESSTETDGYIRITLSDVCDLPAGTSTIVTVSRVGGQNGDPDDYNSMNAMRLAMSLEMYSAISQIEKYAAKDSEMTEGRVFVQEFDKTITGLDKSSDKKVQAASILSKMPLSPSEKNSAGSCFAQPGVFVRAGSAGNRRLYYSPALSQLIIDGLYVVGSNAPLRLGYSSCLNIVSGTSETIAPKEDGTPRKISTLDAEAKLASVIPDLTKHLFDPEIFGSSAYPRPLPLSQMYTLGDKTQYALTVTLTKIDGIENAVVIDTSSPSLDEPNALYGAYVYHETYFPNGAFVTSVSGQTLQLSTAAAVSTTTSFNIRVTIMTLSLNQVTAITPRAPIWSAGDYRVMPMLDGAAECSSALPFNHWYAWPLLYGFASSPAFSGTLEFTPDDLNVYILNVGDTIDMTESNAASDAQVADSYMIQSSSNNGTSVIQLNAEYFGSSYVFSGTKQGYNVNVVLRNVNAPSLGTAAHANLTDGIQHYLNGDQSIFKSVAVDIVYPYLSVSELETCAARSLIDTNMTLRLVTTSGPFNAQRSLFSSISGDRLDLCTGNMISATDTVSIRDYFLYAVTQGRMYFSESSAAELVKITTAEFDAATGILTITAEKPLPQDVSAYGLYEAMPSVSYNGIAYFAPAWTASSGLVLTTPASADTTDINLPESVALRIGTVMYSTNDMYLSSLDGGEIDGVKIGAVFLKSAAFHGGSSVTESCIITQSTQLGADTDGTIPVVPSAYPDFLASCFTGDEGSYDGVLDTMRASGRFGALLGSEETTKAMPYIASHEYANAIGVNAENGVLLGNRIMVDDTHRMGREPLDAAQADVLASSGWNTTDATGDIVCDASGECNSMPFDSKETDRLTKLCTVTSETIAMNECDTKTSSLFLLHDRMKLNDGSYTGTARTSFHAMSGNTILQAASAPVAKKFSDLSAYLNQLSADDVTAPGDAFDCINNYVTARMSETGILSSLFDGMLPQTQSATADAICALIDALQTRRASSVLSDMTGDVGFWINDEILPDSVVGIIAESAGAAAQCPVHVLRYRDLENGSMHYLPFSDYMESITSSETLLKPTLDTMRTAAQAMKANSKSRLPDAFTKDSTKLELFKYATQLYYLSREIMPIEDDDIIYLRGLRGDAETEYRFGWQLARCGLWYYNARKRYALLASIANLYYTFAMRLLSIMSSFKTSTRPFIDEEMSYTADTPATAFPAIRLYSFTDKSGMPLYPILSGPVSIADMGHVRLNHIDRLFPEGKLQYQFNAKLSKTIVDGEYMYNVLMPSINASDTYEDDDAFVMSDDYAEFRYGFTGKETAHGYVSNLLMNDALYNDSGNYKKVSGDTTVTEADITSFITNQSTLRIPDMRSYDTSRSDTNHVDVESGRVFAIASGVTRSISVPLNFTAQFQLGYPRRIDINYPKLTKDVKQWESAVNQWKDELIKNYQGLNKTELYAKINPVVTGILNSIKYNTTIAANCSLFDCTLYGSADPQIEPPQKESMWLQTYTQELLTGAPVATKDATIDESMKSYNQKDTWANDGKSNTEPGLAYPSADNYNLCLSKRRAYTSMMLILDALISQTQRWSTFHKDQHYYRIVYIEDIKNASPKDYELKDSFSMLDSAKVNTPFKAYGFGAMLYTVNTKKDEYLKYRVSVIQATTKNDDIDGISVASANITPNLEQNLDFSMGSVVKLPDRSVYFPEFDGTPMTTKKATYYSDQHINRGPNVNAAVYKANLVRLKAEMESHIKATLGNNEIWHFQKGMLAKVYLIVAGKDDFIDGKIPVV